MLSFYYKWRPTVLFVAKWWLFQLIRSFSWEKVGQCTRWVGKAHWWTTINGNRSFWTLEKVAKWWRKPKQNPTGKRVEWMCKSDVERFWWKLRHEVVLRRSDCLKRKHKNTRVWWNESYCWVEQRVIDKNLILLFISLSF